MNMQIAILFILVIVSFGVMARVSKKNKIRTNYDDPQYKLKKQYERGEITFEKYYEEKAKLYKPEPKP